MSIWIFGRRVRDEKTAPERKPAWPPFGISSAAHMGDEARRDWLTERGWYVDEIGWHHVAMPSWMHSIDAMTAAEFQWRYLERAYLAARELKPWATPPEHLPATAPPTFALSEKRDKDDDR